MIRFKEFRKRSGLSQREAAEKLGMDRTYLSKIENGRQKIYPNLLFKMAKLYNVSPEELLDIEKKAVVVSFGDKSHLDPDAQETLEKIERIMDVLLVEIPIGEKQTH